MANPTTNLGITLPADENTAQKVTTYNDALNELDAANDGYLTKSVAGAAGAATPLTRAEALHKFFKFTGAITGNRTLAFPASGGCARIINVWNATTGAFSFTIKLGASTGIAVTQGKKVFLANDGTDWYVVAPEV